MNLPQNDLVQPANWNPKKSDGARVVDRLAVGPQFKLLMHHQRPFDPVVQEQTGTVRKTGYRACRVGERCPVVAGTRGMEQPGSPLGRFALEGNDLLQAKGPVGLVRTLAVDMERACLAEEEPQRTISLAVAREAVAGSERRPWLLSQGVTEASQGAKTKSVGPFQFRHEIQHLDKTAAGITFGLNGLPCDR